MYHVTYSNADSGNAYATQSYQALDAAKALAVDAVRNAGGASVARIWTEDCGTHAHVDRYGNVIRV